MQGFSVLNIFLLLIGGGSVGFINTVAGSGPFLAISDVCGSVPGACAAALAGME